MDHEAATPQGAAPQAGGKDWEVIERAYRAGVLSVSEIARQGGVTEGAIRKRAKRDDWERSLVAQQKVVLQPEPEGPRSGFVYVIYVDTGLERLFKIGMAKSFADRLASHQCSSPFELCVAVVYFSGDMRAEEGELHRVLDGKRVRGEWFRLDADDLRWIASRSLLVAA